MQTEKIEQGFKVFLQFDQIQWIVSIQLWLSFRKAVEVTLLA